MNYACNLRNSDVPKLLDKKDDSSYEFSLRNRRSSSSSSRFVTPPSEMSSWSRRNSLNQWEMLDEWIQRRFPSL